MTEEICVRGLFGLTVTEGEESTMAGGHGRHGNRSRKLEVHIFKQEHEMNYKWHKSLESQSQGMDSSTD